MRISIVFQVVVLAVVAVTSVQGHEAHLSREMVNSVEQVPRNLRSQTSPSEQEKAQKHLEDPEFTKKLHASNVAENNLKGTKLNQEDADDSSKKSVEKGKHHRKFEDPDVEFNKRLHQTIASNVAENNLKVAKLNQEDADDSSKKSVEKGKHHRKFEDPDVEFNKRLHQAIASNVAENNLKVAKLEQDVANYKAKIASKLEHEKDQKVAEHTKKRTGKWKHEHRSVRFHPDTKFKST